MFQDQVLKSSSLSKKQAEKYKFIKVDSFLNNWHVSRFKKLFNPCARQLLDTAYLLRFKKET